MHNLDLTHIINKTNHIPEKKRTKTKNDEQIYSFTRKVINT